MSISTKLAYLRETKALIKEAIINKGVAVSDSDTFRDYADKIADIQGGGREYYMDFEFDNNDYTDACSSRTMNTTYGTITDGVYVTDNSNTITIGYLYSDILRKQNACLELKMKISSYNSTYAANVFEMYNGQYEKLNVRIASNSAVNVTGYCGSSSDYVNWGVIVDSSTVDTWMTIKVKFIQKPTRCFEVYFNDSLLATVTSAYEFPRFNAIYINGGGDWDNNRRGVLHFDYIRMYIES